MNQKGLTPIISLFLVVLLVGAIFIGVNKLGNISQFVSKAAASSGTNEIVLENSKPGSPPSEWDIKDSGGQVISGIPDPNNKHLNSDQDSGYSNIQGFADPFSINKGQRIGFKIRTDAPNYKISIYRLGYYQGNGARKVTEMTVNGPSNYQGPNDAYNLCSYSDAGVGHVRLIDCGNWQESSGWQTNVSTVSGVYIAKLERQDGTPGVSHIYFVVRDDNGSSDILLQTSDTTWQAYNTYTAASLYRNVDEEQPWSTKVSYNRPFYTRSNIQNLGKRSFLFNAEYPLIRFLEKNGFNLSYVSGWDLAQNQQLPLGHHIFISSGHDEYWSQEQHDAVRNARDNGVNLVFMSGNTHYWKTRWENSIDGSNTPKRTMVTFKESAADGNFVDPSTEWTGLWRDPRFPADFTPQPENSLLGNIFTANGERVDQMKISSQFAPNRFWRNTAVANLSGNQELGLLPVGILGHEWGSDLDNGYRPSGLIDLSATKLFIPEKKITGYAEVFSGNGSPLSIDGEETAHMTLYKQPSSQSWVFSTGTIQWAWGLDPIHDRTDVSGSGVVDKNAQQSTINLLADMHALPATLQTDLVAATATSDVTPPTVTFNNLPAGVNFYKNTLATVSGTASDIGGSVGGVEVSTDNGASWHPASGTTNWSYQFAPTAAGVLTVKARAIDDSLNTGAIASVSISIADTYSGWNENSTVVHSAGGNIYKITLGVKFKPNVNGQILGVRFYKNYANVGDHTAQIWTNTGTKLGETTYLKENERGWQTASFSSPIPVSANSTYIASYVAPHGKYAFSDGYFNTHSVANSAFSLLDSVYAFDSVFPTETYNKSNYWVDIVFLPDSAQPTPTPTPTPSPTGNTSISGRSFVDSNNNFNYDPGEINLINQLITLSGDANKTTLTNGQGQYSFANLAMGNYRIKMNRPAGLQETTDIDGPATTSQTTPNPTINLIFKQTLPLQPILGNSYSYCAGGTIYNHFEWTNITSNPSDFYRILRKTEGQTNYTLDAGTSGYGLTETNVAPNTKYFYQVEANYYNGATSASDTTFYINTPPACN